MHMQLDGFLDVFKRLFFRLPLGNAARQRRHGCDEISIFVSLQNNLNIHFPPPSGCPYNEYTIKKTGIAPKNNAAQTITGFSSESARRDKKGREIRVHTLLHLKTAMSIQSQFRRRPAAADDIMRILSLRSEA
jgi:hypothetical protein